MNLIHKHRPGSTLILIFEIRGPGGEGKPHLSKCYALDKSNEVKEANYWTSFMNWRERPGAAVVKTLQWPAQRINQIKKDDKSQQHLDMLWSGKVCGRSDPSLQLCLISACVKTLTDRHIHNEAFYSLLCKDTCKHLRAFSTLFQAFRLTDESTPTLTLTLPPSTLSLSCLFFLSPVSSLAAWRGE